MIIRLKVFEQTLSIVDTRSVPRKGSKDYLVLQFLFSSDWKDLNKVCYLQHGEVSQPIEVVDNLVEVPEWFTQQDRFYITLFGKSGNQEVQTNVVQLRLDKSNTLWEKDAPEPQPSWLAKVIDLNNHPPIPGGNGYWLLWDTDKGEYVESELSLPAVGGTSDHSNLINRDAADQHPMSAVTGLVEALEGKQPAGMGITGAAVGQIAKITAVDDSGKPTAWEAGDLPNNEKFIVTFGGNGSSYACDKTMDEIVNAYENGQDISAYFTGTSESGITYTNLLLSLATYDPGTYIEFKSDIEIYKLFRIVAFIDGTEFCGVSEYTALDNSLTENHMAADAKAVGDALGRKQDTLIQSGATVGQIAKITAVDDNGKPTAWEAVDMPSGGGAPFSFDLIVDHTVTAEDLSVSRLTWTNETIQDLGKYNLFYAVIESDTEFGITKWIKFYINNSPVSTFAGSSSPKCKIIPATCNRFFGKWIGTSVYNPVNSVPFPVLVGPCESVYQGLDALKSAEDARSIAIGSHAADFGLAEGMRIKVYAMI